MSRNTSNLLKILKIQNSKKRLNDRYKTMSVNDIAQHIKKKDIAPSELTHQQSQHIKSILKE